MTDHLFAVRAASGGDPPGASELARGRWQAAGHGKIYKLAANDFILGGGDGYQALTRGKAIIDASAGILMATTVMDPVVKQGAACG